MDFGLARLTEASRLTKVDTAMGTVAYMSPEQAQGMDVDSRTDIGLSVACCTRWSRASARSLASTIRRCLRDRPRVSLRR